MPAEMTATRAVSRDPDALARHSCGNASRRVYVDLVIFGVTRTMEFDS